MTFARPLPSDPMPRRRRRPLAVAACACLLACVTLAPGRARRRAAGRVEARRERQARRRAEEGRRVPPEEPEGRADALPEGRDPVAARPSRGRDRRVHRPHAGLSRAARAVQQPRGASTRRRASTTTRAARSRWRSAWRRTTRRPTRTWATSMPRWPPARIAMRGATTRTTRPRCASSTRSATLLTGPAATVGSPTPAAQPASTGAAPPDPRAQRNVGMAPAGRAVDADALRIARRPRSSCRRSAPRFRKARTSSASARRTPPRRTETTTLAGVSTTIPPDPANPIPSINAAVQRWAAESLDRDRRRSASASTATPPSRAFARSSANVRRDDLAQPRADASSQRRADGR